MDNDIISRLFNIHTPLRGDYGTSEFSPEEGRKAIGTQFAIHIPELYLSILSIYSLHMSKEDVGS